MISRAKTPDYGGIGVFTGRAPHYACAMSRAAQLDQLLRALVTLEPLPPVMWTAPPATDPFTLSTSAIAAVWAGEFDAALTLARSASVVADDAEARALTAAAGGLARSGASTQHLTVPLDEALETHSSFRAAIRVPLLCMLAESALSEARVDLAERFLQVMPVPDQLFGGSHPFLPFLHAFRARVRLFAGDISAADSEVNAGMALVSSDPERLFLTATLTAIAAAAGRRAQARAGVRSILASDLSPTNAAMSGVLLLAAYAADVDDDTPTAARAVLRAATSADFARLRTVDRAFALEVLTRVALEEGDLDAAGAWLLRALPLSDHPIGGPTVDRIVSRMALADGDPQTALAAAQRSVDRARERGREFEAAAAELLVGKARIALSERGEAARHFEQVVARTDPAGFAAVRASAARELRAIGRRLPPEAHRGWDVLSPREQQIGLHVAAGLSNAEIATVEYLSEHTVRIHVSRVLHAFGVATRAGVAAALAGRQPGADDIERPALTRRQQQVVELIAAGATNRAIAEHLGLSESTVEKHVSAVLHRWDLSSRAAIAHAASRDAQRRSLR